VTRILGIDPGVRGGLALVEINDGAAPQLLEAIDIPVTGVSAKERVDVLAIRAWVMAHQPQHAYIERAQALPKQGASSGFKYGRSGRSSIISAAATRKVLASARSNSSHLRTRCSRASAIIRGQKRR